MVFKYTEQVEKQTLDCSSQIQEDLKLQQDLQQYENLDAAVEKLLLEVRTIVEVRGEHNLIF